MPENKYLRALYAAAREHKVDSEALHETVLARFQCVSLKDLSNEQACDLMNSIRGITKKTWQKRQAMNYQGRKDSPREPGEVEHLVTEGELHVLRAAAEKRSWSSTTLSEFCTRQIKKPLPTTTRELNKVIWAIKAMNRR